MDKLNVSIQGVLFAELLFARSEAGTLELLLNLVMCLLVLPEASASVKGLFATRVITSVVTDVLVLGFDMVLKMAVS